MGKKLHFFINRFKPKHMKKFIPPPLHPPRHNSACEERYSRLIRAFLPQEHKKKALEMPSARKRSIWRYIMCARYLFVNKKRKEKKQKERSKEKIKKRKVKNIYPASFMVKNFKILTLKITSWKETILHPKHYYRARYLPVWTSSGLNFFLYPEMLHKQFQPNNIKTYI